MSSIGSASGVTRDISTISNEKKDQLIQTLQKEVKKFKDQVEVLQCNIWSRHILARTTHSSALFQSHHASHLPSVVSP